MSDTMKHINKCEGKEEVTKLDILDQIVLALQNWMDRGSVTPIKKVSFDCDNDSGEIIIDTPTQAFVISTSGIKETERDDGT